jgi:hypothetical protein
MAWSENVKWICLALHTVQLRAVVNTVMNLGSDQNGGFIDKLKYYQLLKKIIPVHVSGLLSNT